MKRILSIAALFGVLAGFTGCGDSASAPAPKPAEGGAAPATPAEKPAG
jgi:hypothetical protein